MSKRVQPNWQPPNTTAPKFNVLNSLTRTKVPFIPIDNNTNHISWYSCGPTVYDASHMGHARNYISIDILRRIVTDYFGYNCTFVQGLTDIDDKIILRARQSYLFEKFKKDPPDNYQTIIDNSVELLKSKLDKEEDKGKKEMYQNLHNQCIEGLKSNDKITKITKCKDALMAILDDMEGHTITDNQIFWDLPRYWEKMYWEDMDRLNVRRPTTQIRVSECVPEIINFIKDILKNNFAYESNGSVYFDVNGFNDSKDHFYAKLEPENMGNIELVEDGEGKLAASTSEKKNENDFALWKKSKPGQPSWESPWSHGRPGWHIECSVMSTIVLGQKFDIHTGGVDLKFPHHDNEIAQSEAAFNSNSWCNYFLHAGHLHINGLKMSKSLKNFTSIAKALENNNVRTVRLAFLMHTWHTTLDYSDENMKVAESFEKSMNEFFLNVKSYKRKFNGDKLMKPDESALKLLHKFETSKQQVHKSLADNFNTPLCLQYFKDLVSSSNIYIQSINSVNEMHISLLEDIAKYLTKMFKIFGVIGDDIYNEIGFESDLQMYKAKNTENNVDCSNIAEPTEYLDALGDFRETVKKAALENDTKTVLTACDVLRNETLPLLGVRMEDDTKKGVNLKIIGKKQAMLEKEQKIKEQKAKLAAQLKAEQEALKKELKAKIPHTEMFINSKNLETLELKSFINKFSEFDLNGIPILEICEKDENNPKGTKQLAKGQSKKVLKIYNNQKKVHENWKKKQVTEHEKWLKEGEGPWI